MTTNAIDKINSIVACDSRWSGDLIDGEHVLTIDDSGFQKLGIKQAGCMVVAGDLLLIEGWMNWFHAPVWNFLQTPALNRNDERGQLCNVIFHLVLSNGKIMFPPLHPSAVPPLEYEDQARFVGTGARFAHDCFAINGCVKTSVATAAKSDVYTGGATAFVDVRNNAAEPTTLTESAASLREAMITRGIVMNRRTMQPVGTLNEFSAKQAAMGNTAAANLSNLVVSAPTGVPAFVWTHDQKSELMKAFAEMAVLEEELKAK